ncbi:holin [Pantoea sp. FN0307]|uniref:holin n=1 Tax=unclassified Pantoea TaxID=2630326 RepID=UPI003CF3C7C3
MMQEHEKSFYMLVLMGGVIALGKLLAEGGPITSRVVFGRVILGSALTVAAGAVLYFVPELPMLAVLGIGSAMGIAGQQGVEVWLRRRIGITKGNDQ